MGLLKFSNKGMQVISACVPKNVIHSSDFYQYFGKEHVDKFVETTGIEERRFADGNTCASDLCLAAAENIFNSTSIKKDDINMLIYVTQTQDYRTPGMGVSMQNTLGLSKDTIVYDLNVACTAFLHGLVMAYTFLDLPGFNKVLLLVGDTLSKIISKKDKSTGMLLADAGIAAVISKGEQYGDSFFSMNSDGAFVEAVMTKGGGYRHMSSYETLEYKTFDDGSVRNMEQNYMNGMDVFSYAISRLPKDVKRLLEFAKIDKTNIDKCAFHQANKFMMSTIAKKTGIDQSKFLYSIYKFGNTSGCSIPLTLVVNKDIIKKDELILMNAIGAGFLYGTALCNIADCEILNLIEI